MIVTIDGHAGAGKSTAARMLATALGYEMLNTGAMYRAAAWALADAGLDVYAEPPDLDGIQQHLTPLTFDLSGDCVRIGPHDVTHCIHTEELGRAASRVATFLPVRRHLQAEQRRIVNDRNMIAEGRDQGTVVFPSASVKFFVTATVEHRARRRAAQLGLASDAEALAELAHQIAARDTQDATRALDPLLVPPGAIIVDTSELGRDQVLILMLNAVRQCPS